MDKEQLRHCKRMASKVRSCAERIVSEMQALERSSEQDVRNVPLTNIVNRFGHDSGFGVQDNIDAMEAVIRDMLPTLEAK